MRLQPRIEIQPLAASVFLLLVVTAAIGGLFGHLERSVLETSGVLPLWLFALHAIAGVLGMVAVLTRLALVVRRQVFFHVLLSAGMAALLGELANVALLESSGTGAALPFFVVALSAGSAALGGILRRRRPPSASRPEGGLLGRSQALRAACLVVGIGFLVQILLVLAFPDTRARLQEEFRTLQAAQMETVR